MTLLDDAPPSGMITLEADFAENLFMSDRGDAVSTAPICAEPGCENETVRISNKGPYPKFCLEHRKSSDRTKGTLPSAKGASRAKWAQARSVEANLNKFLDFAALPAAALPAGSPFYNDAMLVTFYGPQIVHELVVLADDDERLRRVLLRMSTPGKYGALVGAIGGLLLGVAANHGVLPPLLANVIASANSQALGGENK
jgi:hypothetical protein